MTENDILSSIDSEIARLQQARNLLTNSGTSTRSKKSATKPVKTKRKLSPEARERIVAAQRKRWAAQKRAKK